MPSPPDTGLPVESSVAAVRAALEGEHRAAVLVAAPGAGKTTVMPLRLLDEPWLADRRIVMLEPRRLATRAAARRMAHLMGEDVGNLVGYQTRDERRASASTRVEVVTEGVLTRRLQHDRLLPGVGLVIFDEFHERNVQTDLGLAFLLDVRSSLRDDLRVLVMSATLDTKGLASRLPGAPVVASEGREFPVDVVWLPRARRDRLDDAAAAAIKRALREHEGDVLVFLPGAGEIRRVEQRLRAEGLDHDVAVRLLFGALSSAEQDDALAASPAGTRRIVLATDIAETSLTVPGIRIVVDAGLARVPRHDARTGVTRLVTVSASKSSAEQRAGRAGRLDAGVAYRLWSKLEHAARPLHLPPEITQIDLAGVALELAMWTRAERPEQALPFLDAPPARPLADARSLLRLLGALDDRDAITDVGREMATLPLHPRLAHMVIAARGTRDAFAACLLAALVEERDILRGPTDQLPADVTIRLELLFDPSATHPLADRRAVAATRDRGADIARRAGIPADGAVDLAQSGRLLASAYTDRIADNRSLLVAGVTRGRFRLPDGTSAWVAPEDALAAASRVVAIDLDGRKDPRIRLGAALA